MADNYLEKRYAEMAQGRPIIRKQNKSLDSLLKAVAETPTNINKDYIVEQAQLNAMVFSASRLNLPFEVTSLIKGKEAQISLNCPSSFILGQIVLALKLKAAELHLHCECKDSSEKSATITVNSLFR